LDEDDYDDYEWQDEDEEEPEPSQEEPEPQEEPESQERALMQLLGHKNIANTLIYTQLIEFEDDDKCCSAMAHNAEEAQQLIESGFEYVCNHKDSMLFRVLLTS
jgi:hypothetical protein